jgi:carboxyl-terminal processing protease
MKNTSYKNRSLVVALLLAAILLSSVTCVFASLAGTVSADKGMAAVVGISENVPVEYSVVDQACDLICQGKFDAADELFKKNSDSSAKQFSEATRQLSQIIDEYQDINQQMKLEREKTYSERLSGLDKLRTEADVNDVNDITEVLAAVAEVSELADKNQKGKLFSDEFVKGVLQKAIDKATGFEAEGKWLEAYVNCYAWLVVIDPNNEGYSDYAQQIYDKATIVASLEDSPCETTEERYDGVDKKIFIRTINYLDLHYVNRIDYKEMVTKALERCKLLGEVMEFPPDDFKILSENQKTGYGYKQSLSAWSVALEAMQDEVERDSVGMSKDRFLNVFEKILKLNETTVDLPHPLLIAHFSEAALSSLDSYTIIVWPRQVQEFEKLMTNEFSGIGIEISKPKGKLTVSSLLPDTPAYKSGLDAGDVIEAVDGIETKDMTLTCAVRKITGPRGTKVKLTIKRPGEEGTNDIVITRGKIVVPTIRGWQRTDAGQWLYMIDPEDKIGYVRLTSFSAESSDDLERVLDELEDEGLKGLILDLRYNSGGLLESAIDVSNKFIDEGMIVSRQSGFGRLPVYAEAEEKGTHPNYPLVVLVNSNSASASEIVAGALADKAHKRAILVGTRTHGKGSVQGVTNSIGDGAQLKYTMAYYHLPSGQRVESREEAKKQGNDDWGVGPNIAVDLNSEEIKKMIDVQRDNDVLVRADHDDTKDATKKHTLKETLESDLQLAVGLLVVKSKLVQAEALELAKSDS